MIALSEQNFTQNSLQNLKNEKLNAAFFNKQTNEGLNTMFNELCKLLTSKNISLKAKESKKNRLEILSKNEQALFILCLLFNIYAQFIMLRWINQDFSVLPLIGIYIGSIICVLIQHFLLFISVSFSMCCCFNDKAANDNYIKDVMIFSYKVLYLIFSGISIIFDLVTLGLAQHMPMEEH
ncbi:hypothetical protein FGO68_gene13958 [Halteria grandinella]|uniref:Uncharacterized protein n=1 Tax=Halteria grandinella TaxID=5974 RepID=A0A8J8NM23_HALGN|nr:hypothetical protein FGO68_gene13958 [Halteria grandinella]